jgi:hypothetical protein
VDAEPVSIAKQWVKIGSHCLDKVKKKGMDAQQWFEILVQTWHKTQGCSRIT